MDWKITDAEGHLREVIDLALSEGPQHIRTESGATVVVSRAPTTPPADRPARDFIEFLRSAPKLTEDELKLFERNKTPYVPKVIFDESTQ